MVFELTDVLTDDRCVVSLVGDRFLNCDGVHSDTPQTVLCVVCVFFSRP